MADPRTFKVDQSAMKGDDIKAWQQDFNSQMESWNIDFRIKADGVWGMASRSATATWLYALGIERSAMADGVTPDLRTKVRHRRLSRAERARFVARAPWRARLRARWARGVKVARPSIKVLQATWGWTPSRGPNAGRTHDGLDVTCPQKATLYAMCKMRIVRADNDNWWGKSPSGNVRLGDGIVIGKVVESVGPFKAGQHICYGHAEKMRVRVGEVVEAGTPIAECGLAVTWHFHMMVNGGTMRGDFAVGMGDRNPMPYLKYALKHG